MVIVPAVKVLRLFSCRYRNFFLLCRTAYAEFFGFAFDDARIVLQVIDLFLNVQILRCNFLDLRIQALVLIDFAPQLSERTEIDCQTEQERKQCRCTIRNPSRDDACPGLGRLRGSTWSSPRSIRVSNAGLLQAVPPNLFRFRSPRRFEPSARFLTDASASSYRRRIKTSRRPSD